MSYTEAQADQGHAVYLERCATCHGDNMDDGEFAPPLKGVAFRERWRTESPGDLFSLTQATMPQDRPGSLADEEYAQLLALIYQENGSPAGQDTVPSDAATLLALAPPLWNRGGGGGLARESSCPRPPVGTIRSIPFVP